MKSSIFISHSAPIPIHWESPPCRQESKKKCLMRYVPRADQRIWEEKLRLQEQVAKIVDKIIQDVIFNLQQERQSQDSDNELFFGELEY
jgi:hypothetical protein